MQEIHADIQSDPFLRSSNQKYLIWFHYQKCKQQLCVLSSIWGRGPFFSSHRYSRKKDCLRNNFPHLFLLRRVSLVCKCKALGSNLHGHYCQPLLSQTAGSGSDACACDKSFPCTRLCSCSPPEHTPHPAPIPPPLAARCQCRTSRLVPHPFRHTIAQCITIPAGVSPFPPCHSGIPLPPTGRVLGPGQPCAAHPPGLPAEAASARLCRTGAAAAPTAHPAGPAGTQGLSQEQQHPHPAARGLSGASRAQHRLPGARQAELSLACVPCNHCGAAPAHLECPGSGAC